MLVVVTTCLCARAGTIGWASGALEIPAGDELTITTPSLTNTSVTVRGTFSVNLGSGSKSYYILADDDRTKETTSHLAPYPSDVALWKTGPGRVYGYYNDAPRANLVIGNNGGGNGLLHVGAFQGSNGNYSTCWLRFVTLSANAQTDADHFEPILLDSYGNMMCSRLINDNTKPLQVTFTNQWNVASNQYVHFSGYLQAFYNAYLFSTKKAGGDIVLRGHPNAPVVFKGWGRMGFNMFDNSAANRKALVRLEGDCEAWFVINNTWCIFNATNIAYNHSGDTKFVFQATEGGYIRTLVENVLPWGANTGNLVLSTIGDGVVQKNLDLHGYSQKLNGLVIEGEAQLVNTNEAVTLTFGAGDTDGKLSGLITNETVFCEKVGSGTLSLESADVYSLVATNGGVIAVAAGSNHVHTLTIDVPLTFADGAILTADEWHVGTNTLIALDSASPTNVVHLTFPVAHDLPCIKEGANFVTYATPEDAQGSTLSVRGGTLRFGGEACTNAWWRFTVTKASTDTAHFTSTEVSEFSCDLNLGLGSLGMFAADGRYAYQGFANAASGTAAPSLSEAYVASTRPWMSWNLKTMQSLYPSATKDPILNGGESSGGPCKFVQQSSDHFKTPSRYDIAATSADTWISAWPVGVLFSNGVVSAESPEIITWRAKSEWGRESVSYAMRRCVNNDQRTSFPHPKDWMLESSADGVNWEKMDERTNQTFTITSEPPYVNAQFGYTYNAHVPYIFSAKNANWKFKTFGTVDVAAGATLDLSEIPMTNIAFNALSVDCAGAGKITRFRPAESGTLYVTSSAAVRRGDGRLESKVTLPLVLGETADMGNLAGWSVYVDGVRAQASFAAYENGKIVLRTNYGTMLFFR